MPVFRWVVVAMIAGVAGSTSTTEAAPPKVATANPHEAEPRVVVGEAVLYIYDESGKIVAVE